MTPERWRQVEAIFHLALEQDSADRADYVARTCAGNSTLQSAVERLLVRDEQASRESFLAALDLSQADTPEDTPPPESSLLGHRLGPYQVREAIGRGGMGTVYRAERVVDYRQQVAIKVIKSSLNGDHLPRFQTERQVLAELHHPHIARLLDGGTTDEGTPYLVMEFLDGRPLHRYCEDRQLTTRQRLELFLPVCQAVQHAHERGIVHRDLKPGNVLVTADGVPKVTDFGLAKRVQAAPGMAQGEAHTQSGAVVGTPSYMAPEQAAGNTRAVGPPADVYALGAILYELLTGRPPFRGEGAWAILAQVVGVEPIPPRQLQPGMARDVETICLKCLEKEPGRRYASAQALAEDVERYLAGQPLQARPVSRGERAWRWCRRRPAVAALAAALLLAVTTGIGGVVWQWRQTEAERARAEDRREEAVRFAGELAGTLKRLGASHHKLGSLLKRHALLKEAEPLMYEAIQDLEHLIREFPPHPDHDHELALSHDALGDLHRLLDRHDRAEEAWQKAGAIYAKIAAEHPTHRAYLANHGRVLYNLGALASERHQHEKAIDLLTQALTSLESTPPVAGQDWFIQQTYPLRAWARYLAGQYAEALPDWDRAIQLAPAEQRNEYRLLRAQAQAALGDYAAAVAAALDVLAAAPKSGQQLDDLARVYAHASQSARTDATRSAADRAALAERYAIAGVETLRQALAAGFYQDATRSKALSEEAVYASLRSWPTFQKLLPEVKPSR